MLIGLNSVKVGAENFKTLLSGLRTLIKQTTMQKKKF